LEFIGQVYEIISSDLLLGRANVHFNVFKPAVNAILNLSIEIHN